MRIKSKLFFCGLVLLTPVLLNFLLPLAINDIHIIGGNESEVTWLNFWGGYIGSIISSIIAFYVLYVNRKDNFNVLKYQYENSMLQEKIRTLIAYIEIYNINNVKLIYNKWRFKKGDAASLSVEVKELLDKAFITFESFSLNYSANEFDKIPFLKKQKENYTSLVHFLQDFEVLLNFKCESWDKPSDFKAYIFLHQKECNEIISISFLEAIKNTSQEKDSLFNILCKTYKDITQQTIESQVRTYIETERLKLDKKFNMIIQ